MRARVRRIALAGLVARAEWRRGRRRHARRPPMPPPCCRTAAWALQRYWPDRRPARLRPVVLQLFEDRPAKQVALRTNLRSRSILHLRSILHPRSTPYSRRGPCPGWPRCLRSGSARTRLPNWRPGGSTIVPRSSRWKARPGRCSDRWPRRTRKTSRANRVRALRSKSRASDGREKSTVTSIDCHPPPGSRDGRPAGLAGCRAGTAGPPRIRSCGVARRSHCAPRPRA